VLRAFQDENVIHVDGTINPERDAETIGMELALADLEAVSKRLQNAEKQMKAGKTKDLELEIVALTKAKAALGSRESDARTWSGRMMKRKPSSPWRF
jgi:ribosome-binding ATPase YchF (GTP1/OBG family)